MPMCSLGDKYVFNHNHNCVSFVTFFIRIKVLQQCTCEQFLMTVNNLSALVSLVIDIVLLCIFRWNCCSKYKCTSMSLFFKPLQAVNE